MSKKLYRSTNDRKISGVCGGIAEYLDIDVTIIRVLWVIGTIVSFFTGFFIYIACVFIIPEDDGFYDGEFKEK